jgi:hypothetical protein
MPRFLTFKLAIEVGGKVCKDAHLHVLDRQTLTTKIDS